MAYIDIPTQMQGNSKLRLKYFDKDKTLRIRKINALNESVMVERVKVSDLIKALEEILNTEFNYIP